MKCTCKQSVFALTTHIDGIFNQYDSLMEVIKHDGLLDKNTTITVDGSTYTVGEIQSRITEHRKMIKQYTKQYYKCCTDAEKKSTPDPFKW